MPLFFLLFPHIFSIYLWLFCNKQIASAHVKVLSGCLQRVLFFFSLSEVLCIRRSKDEHVFGFNKRLFTTVIHCGMKPAFFISHTSHCKSTATSKSQQTGYVYQMYPAYPNDKIINLLRLGDSLVRQQFEFILSWDQSLFSLPCLVSVTLKTSLFTAS